MTDIKEKFSKEISDRNTSITWDYTVADKVLSRIAVRKRHIKQAVAVSSLTVAALLFIVFFVSAKNDYPVKLNRFVEQQFDGIYMDVFENHNSGKKLIVNSPDIDVLIETSLYMR